MRLRLALLQLPAAHAQSASAPNGLVGAPLAAEAAASPPTTKPPVTRAPPARPPLKHNVCASPFLPHTFSPTCCSAGSRTLLALVDVGCSTRAAAAGCVAHVVAVRPSSRAAGLAGWTPGNPRGNASSRPVESPARGKKCAREITCDNWACVCACAAVPGCCKELALIFER